jgi:hypothetical protein
MSDLVVAGALSELRRLVVGRVPPSPAELSIQLRALQRLGLTKQDLVVQIERLRARNDATDEDEMLEENALLALDLVEGATRIGLSWNAAELAAAWVPAALNLHQLEAGGVHALSASDLLPSRREVVKDDLLSGLIQTQWSRLVDRAYAPTTADFFRAPKTGLTTRPAALLAPQDRLVFEGFAEAVAEASSAVLPSHVMWPRGRDGLGAYSAFARAPHEWTSDFVLRTDISRFYETVDHSFLSVVVAHHLGLRGAFPIALEAFLDAVMGSNSGLPQGPSGSDVLASAYLLDIDREISRLGWPIVRYSDDILVGASSFQEARGRLRNLEGLLRERGLSLSSDKSRIFRRETYLATIDSDPDASAGDRSLRERVRREVAIWFETHPEASYEGVVDALALPEQLQWDLLYHETVTWEEALSEIDDQVLPPWIRAYERVYKSEAHRLSTGGYPSADEALSVSDLRKCLIFMRADVQPFDLVDSHAIIDWHPTLVRDFSGYLSASASISPDAAAAFIKRRLLREGDSDVELAWLLEAAVQDHGLARALKGPLTTVATLPSRPLAQATALRALDNIGEITDKARRDILDSFTPALRAEMMLATTWQKHAVKTRRRSDDGS